MLFALAALKLASSSLLHRARSDPDAFADFYDAYSRNVLLFLTRRVLDAEVALDLMSETFAKALERRRQFRGTSAQEEEAWLYAIARSELSHYWRRGHVERAALRRLGVATPSLTDADLERIEELAEVASLARGLRAAVESLPADQRCAVELRVIHDLPYDELASRMQVSQDAARARVSRGLRHLARQLAAEPGLAEDAA